MRYSFTTYWHLQAPIERVWGAIIDPRGWPEWWKYVKVVRRLEAGDEQGIGATFHNEWATALPYTLKFDVRTVKIERPHLLEARSTGELDGTGRWELSSEGPVTVVRYDWIVSTTKGWMNALAPLMKPLFAWNHRVVMDEGGRGLARHLGVRLAKPPEHAINVLAE